MNRVALFLTLFILISGCYMFPYQKYYKKEINDSEVINQQKPVMYISRSRKMNFIRLALRENDVFTILSDDFYGCGSYKISNDTIYLNYFETIKLKNKKDIVIFNLKDSTAYFHTFLSKEVENLKILPIQ